MRLAAGLRYGENPHQPAAFYVDESLAEAGRGGVATSIQHHGKEVGRSPILRILQFPVCARISFYIYMGLHGYMCGVC
jgi:hypothetical protein